MHSFETMTMQLTPDQNQTPAHGEEERSEARRASVQPQRIAIVEDELAVAWSLQSTAEDLGHEVIGVFASGEVALEVLGEEQADLLFLDVDLGEGIDGIETARRLRERQPIGILFITGSPDAETRARIAKAIPDAKLMGKPVFRDALEETIAELAARGD
jgi:CheY-like chemotaxis protein